MRIVIKTVLVVLLIAMLAIVGAALTCGQPTLDDLQKRLAQLESQIRTLSPEISKIKETNNTAAEVKNLISLAGL